mgnify:CR=1 FL=1
MSIVCIACTTRGSPHAHPRQLVRTARPGSLRVSSVYGAAALGRTGGPRSAVGTPGAAMGTNSAVVGTESAVAGTNSAVVGTHKWTALGAGAREVEED